MSIAVAGCAGATTTGSTITGSTLKVYAGQPPQGADAQQAQDVLDAERLALQQSGGRVGHFNVVLQPLTGAKYSDDARTAIADPSTIAYLGELAPHSSADSIGITNGLGILQLSPTDTAIELTRPTTAVVNAPTRYYESIKTYGRTFGRVVPDGSREATVLADAMRAAGIKAVYVAHDGSAYGQAIAGAVAADARAKGVSVTAGAADPGAVGSSGADALFVGASDAAVAAKLFDAAAAANPKLKLFGPSALGYDTFAAKLAGAVQRNLQIAAPGFIPSGPRANVTPSGRQFASAFKTAYQHEPGRSAIFGYEAMSLVLDVLRRAGANAASRSAVVSEFHKTANRASVLGTYSIDVDGDTTLAPYVLNHFQAGKLVPFAAMQG